MTQENLIKLKGSLENALKNVNTALQSKVPYPVLTQFDEGGYTDGYKERGVVIIQSEIEDGELYINFYSK